MRLKFLNIAAKSFDGASNMSGIQWGLAASIKGASPLDVYIHYYGYRLNLALKSTLADLEPPCNQLHTIQGLYNILDDSTKNNVVAEGV